MSLFGSLDQTIVLELGETIAGSPLLRSAVVALALAGVYAIPIIWVVTWFKSPGYRSLLLSSILAGIIAWIGINNLIQLFYFQNRPVHELPVQEWLFERPENSFPSDHIAFLAAITVFFLLQKKYFPGLLLLLLTVIVGVTRVGVAVHYPSDIVFGFVAGGIAGVIIFFLHPWLTRSVWPSVIVLAKRLKLG